MSNPFTRKASNFHTTPGIIERYYDLIERNESVILKEFPLTMTVSDAAPVMGDEVVSIGSKFAHTLGGHYWFTLGVYAGDRLIGAIEDLTQKDIDEIAERG